MHKTRIGLATALALGLWASSARAQSNEEKLAEKLSKEFATKTAWVMDLDEATKAARESNKLIFAYFSRSYAP